MTDNYQLPSSKTAPILAAHRHILANHRHTVVAAAETMLQQLAESIWPLSLVIVTLIWALV